MSDIDYRSVHAQFAALKAYGSVNIVAGVDSCTIYASRLAPGMPPKVPTVEAKASTLIEAMQEMIRVFDGRD